ncbi:Putative beta-galactosidase, partial [Candidatus Arthromitus sp. SFB-4]
MSLCNEYGIYVVDEGNIEAHGVEGEIPGNKEIWKNACFDRINSLVERDKNNPSVLIWSLGNESGGGSVFRDLYNYVSLRDGTRVIHYEGERDEYYASDVVSKMYVKIDDIEKQSKYMYHKPYILCEYAHSMGNSGGSLDKYIEKFESIDNVQGGFIWDFIDQGIYRDVPDMGIFINSHSIFHGDFEGYIENGYKDKGYRGCIFYDNVSNLKFDEFTIDLKVKPSVYEGEGCVYLKKGNEFGLREIMNYDKSNNRAVEFYVRDNSGIFETIVFITPKDWVN